MVQDTYLRRAIITNVVDGDTVDAMVDLGYGIWKDDKFSRFRLLGVDTPEMHGSEKSAGVRAKEYVEDLILGKEVIIQSLKDDSFGRWLANIWYTDDEGKQVLLNTHLISVGHAKKYR